ncbi:MAG: hypothetical protein ABR529_15595 [Actinomycetota bacterium]
MNPDESNSGGPSGVDELVVLRCERCGDVFPLHAGERRACPSCGAGDIADAAEPLL